MANLLSVHKLAKEFSSRKLFDNLSFGIESNEHIGLIGPNGAGKSTLLKILAGLEVPDQGSVARQSGLRVAYLEQMPSFKPGATVMSTIIEGMDARMEDWEQQYKALELIGRLSTETVELSPETTLESLSGGWKKKVAIAREWAREPDLFLLDEPTNHLDVETILWLEEELAKADYAFVVITHDRLFLQKVTRRILELDRRNPDGLLSVIGDYADYLELKSQTMSAQEKQEDSMKNKLRRETEWMRRGPKARSTKQQARMQRHGELSEDVAEISEQNRVRQVNLQFQSSEGGPKKLIEATKISKTYRGRVLFKDYSLTLKKGSRIGLLGANGCGKSTLIKALLGEIQPDSGTVKPAEILNVAYFEQNRDRLDPEMSLRKSVCPQGDYVKFRGNFVHIRSYLDRFLFDSGHFDLPVKRLSGGEQARILIAQLMLQEANILVLDEPTNDLDVATLDMLQEQLLSFEGAILLVTHDRYFLDQVATEILAFDDGHIESFHGVEQWENWRLERKKRKPAAPTAIATPVVATAQTAPSKKRLGNKEQREYDGMEASIQKLEAELTELSAPSAAQKAEKFTRMATLQSEIERLYARWAELEKLKG